MTTCSVLRCQEPAVDVHTLRHEDENGHELAVCGMHKKMITAGARWVWDKESDSLFLGGDADQAFPRILRAIEVGPQKEAEIVRGTTEPVIRLDLGYGFLGVKGDEHLELHLARPVAVALGEKLTRWANSLQPEQE